MAGLDPISNIADAASHIISLFVADPNIKAKIGADHLAALDEQSLTIVQGEIQEVLAQIQVNAVEAASKSTWVAGWRPYVGWVCGTAFAVPVLMWAVQCAVMIWHGKYDLPQFNSTEITTVLIGILGLGGMRTYEKVNQAAGPDKS